MYQLLTGQWLLSHRCIYQWTCLSTRTDRKKIDVCRLWEISSSRGEIKRKMLLLSLLSLSPTSITRLPHPITSRDSDKLQRKTKFLLSSMKPRLGWASLEKCGVMNTGIWHKHKHQILWPSEAKVEFQDFTQLLTINSVILASPLIRMLIWSKCLTMALPGRQSRGKICLLL